MDKQITEKMVEDAKNKVNELKTIATNYSNKAGMQKGIVDTLYESIVENFRNLKEIFKEVLEENHNELEIKIVPTVAVEVK